jgi:hypothetical protein
MGGTAAGPAGGKGSGIDAPDGATHELDGLSACLLLPLDKQHRVRMK